MESNNEKENLDIEYYGIDSKCFMIDSDFGIFEPSCMKY